jgi:hypothetical protein
MMLFGKLRETNDSESFKYVYTRGFDCKHIRWLSYVSMPQWLLMQTIPETFAHSGIRLWNRLRTVAILRKDKTPRNGFEV